MNPVSPLPIFVIFFLAFATTRLLASFFTVNLPVGRVSTIDGLRGYLGFSVFLHHSCIWFFFLKTGQWALPPSHLYTHLGQTAVALFFMITGFLFFSKIISAKKSPIDWTRLYISRIFRLMPLYLFAIGLTFFIVAILSDWKLHDPLTILMPDAAHWLLFTLRGSPDLNGVKQTSIIMAGVTWTLSYEWAFYWMLPLFAWLMAAARPPAGYLVMAIVTALALKWLHLDLSLMMAFAGGMAAAFLVRHPEFCSFASKKSSSLLIAGCILTVIIIFPGAYKFLPLLLLSIAFSLIAAGNTLFGLLTNHTSRVLGEMAYSIYLLHGLFLFTLIHFLIGSEQAANFSSIEYWTVIALCTPLLISFSFLTFRNIELPGMRIAPKIQNWLQSQQSPHRVNSHRA